MRKVILLLIILLPACISKLEPDANFVGTWELSSIESKSETGEWVPVKYPENAKLIGILMYDDSSNMAVQITTNPRLTEAFDENPEIVNGYIAYYGKYEVDSSVGTVTHHRLNHINPEVGKLSVVRYFQINDDVLTLTVAPEQIQRLNWIRVK
jgi:hypothetical protein